MSFWRFKFASAGNSIDSLLNALPLNSTSPPTLTEIALLDTTLDSLLNTPDLLSEIKSGTNQKLRDFLAREHVVERLGGWILWGLGGEEEDELQVIEGTGGIGIISDDVEDGKVPDVMVGVGTGGVIKKKLKMGRVVRRRDMDLMGVLEGGGTETEEEKLCTGYPRLCTEILATDAPSLTDILYNHSAASSQPETCPIPSTFLSPFWESLLRSTEVQLQTRSIQVGYWARVNSILLNGPKSSEVLAEILSIPHLLPRLLTLLPICSPINDILLLLLRVSKVPSPFTTSLVPQTLRMLDPLAVLGREGHIAAEELLRGVIELCSAAAPPLPPPLSNGNGEMPPAHLSEGGLEWRENGLARQIAAERSIQILVDWILAGTENLVPVEDLEETPKISTTDLPTITTDSINTLRTSSLIQSISVLIDLIRKNNSDFVEQQMLTWARRKEIEDGEKSIEEEEEGLLEIDGDKKEEDQSMDLDKGPSLVDLGPLLTIIAGRLDGFQKLIKTPRSLIGPISTTAGILTPLTLERFRICEFYAELLHCSNMSLVNRPLSLSHLYDSSGYLARGWKAADELSDALAGIQEGEERDSRMPSSPAQHSISTYDASCPVSPVEIPLSYSSGLSSPSGHGSLDSESGILTRAEVKALEEIVAAGTEVEIEDVNIEEDPFSDPVLENDDSLVEATKALEIDSKISRNGISSTSNDYLPPGSILKKMFMEHRVIETVLDMFFEFPWNNFLHNVVFDIIQQIFHGRIDRDLDRQLVISVFLDGRVIDRILGGQRSNDIACALPNGTRLGYMGHMSLIAEEIVKLFHHYPTEIYSIVESQIPQPNWDQYVTTTLRETREKDSAPLGGGMPLINQDNPSNFSGLSDEDDEFPISGGRGMRAVDISSQIDSNSEIVEESNKNMDGSTSDKFSLYLANAISSDRPDKFGSSDEDDTDEDASWLGGSKFDPRDVDFELGEGNDTGPTKFGFEDRFESVGKQVFRSTSPDSDDDADWGPFTTDSPVAKKSNSFSAEDEFRPTITSTSVNFDSAFESFGSDNFNSITTSNFSNQFNHNIESSGDDDDFGDFETASDTTSIGQIITLPSEVLSDFDFAEESRITPTNNSFNSLKRPSFERTITADDGSNLFGSLSDPTETMHDSIVNKATSLEEPLGPSIHPGTHLTSEGMVETLIDGKLIIVPADDIALAHRRSMSIEK